MPSRKRERLSILYYSSMAGFIRAANKIAASQDFDLSLINESMRAKRRKLCVAYPSDDHDSMRQRKYTNSLPSRIQPASPHDGMRRPLIV